MSRYRRGGSAFLRRAGEGLTTFVNVDLGVPSGFEDRVFSFSRVLCEGLAVLSLNLKIFWSLPGKTLPVYIEKGDPFEDEFPEITIMGC